MYLRTLAALLLLSACHLPPLFATYSLDHRQKLELRMSPAGMSVQRDGKTLGRHPLIDPASLRLSTSGQHIVYAARHRDGWHLVIDGKPQTATWDGLLAPSLRVGEGGQVAAVMRRGQSLYVVHDARTYGPYEGVSALQLDSDAAHVAFIARRGALAWAVLDGKEQGPYESLAELRLGARGGRLALILRQDQRWRVVFRNYEAAHDSAAGLIFSDDGERLYYVARESGIERVIEASESRGARSGPPFPRIDWRTINPASEARDNTAPIYIVDDGGQRVVKDGQPGPLYDVVRELTRRGARSAYIGRLARKEQAVIDGQPGPWFDEVGGLALSPRAADFGGYAYLARRDDKLRLVTASGEQLLGWGLAGSLALCEDGSHVALLGGLAPRQLQLIIDGTPVRNFDAEEPEAVRRSWGPSGVRRWLEEELRPRCSTGKRPARGALTAPESCTPNGADSCAGRG